MRFIATVLLPALGLMVIACGGGADADGGATATTETARHTVTPTTPVPAPPWATGTTTATPAATSVAAETPTSAPAATATPPPPTPVPTQPAATPTAAPPTPSPTPAFPTAVIVGIQDDLRFAPNRTTIAAGGTVTFAWNGEVFHNVASEKGGFSTDLVKSGSFTFTISTPGSYPYMCEVHPTTMRGIIDVQ